ncbi:hypothetical protein MCOR20_011133 [Pyricularia oryzae]|nr:hypothetical protein MCOR20_011133 [Pyricularia oryzae]
MPASKKQNKRAETEAVENAEYAKNMDYRSSDDVANRGTERESIDYCYSCAHGMMNSKNRADPCCYNYQGPLGNDAVTIRYLSLSGPSNLRVLAAAFARACTQGEDKYDTDPTAARDGMLGVKAFNIDLPGLSKTELILAALGEEDITKLL